MNVLQGTRSTASFSTTLRIALLLMAICAPHQAARASDVAKGRLALLQEDYDAACIHLARAVESQPEDSEAHRWLGVALVKARQVERGKEHLERARTLAPDDLEVASDLAAAHYQLGEYPLAAKLYASLRARGHEQASFWEGMARLNDGDFAHAVEAFDDAGDDPEVGRRSVYLSGVALYRQRRYDEAEKRFASVALLESDEPLATSARDYVAGIRRATRPLRLNVVVGSVYDDNVLGIDRSEEVDRRFALERPMDIRSDVGVQASWMMVQRPGWQAGASVAFSEAIHRRSREFDERSGRGSLFLERYYGGARSIRLELGVERTDLGRDRFSFAQMLALGGDLWRTQKSVVAVDYVATHTSRAERFGPNSMGHALRLTHTLRIGEDQQTQLSAGAERERGTDRAVLPTRDILRYELYAGYSRSLPLSLGLRNDLRAQWRRFTGLVVVREAGESALKERLVVAGVTLSYPVGESVTAFLSYRHERNASNAGISEYRRNAIGASVALAF